MREGDMAVGLDLGTTKVCAIIAEVSATGGLNVMGVGCTPSDGLRRGVVVDADKTVQSISTAVREAELMAGVKVSSAYTGVTGEHISSIDSNGAIAIGGRKHEIFAADTDRVTDAARTVAIPFNREVLHVLRQGYRVDDRTGIRDPVGMFGVRLETDVHIITGAVTSVQNICKSIQRAEIEVSDVVLEPLASSRAVLTEEEMEMGVAVVDIGGGTTGIAVFAEGTVCHTAVIGLGGQNVTNDIAICLRTSWPEAEALKCQHGTAREETVDAEETIEVAGISGRGPVTIYRAELAAIIEARMEEVLQLVGRELRRSPVAHPMGAGVVLTGGGAHVEGLVDLAEEVLGLPVKVGVPRGFSGLGERVMDPIFATVMGLALMGSEDLHGEVSRNGGLAHSAPVGSVAGRMKGWFSALL